MGVHKRFDAELYKQYDTPGIEAVLTYLDSQGVYAKRGADKYGVDVVVYAGYRPLAYIEVEVVSAWHDGEFPWSHCHVLERKGKWMTQEIGLPVTLYRLNAELTQAILIPDYVVHSGQLEEVPNRLIETGEHMYRVPTSELETICITHGDIVVRED